MTRSLGFGVDDAQPFPDEAVHQRGLAHVGGADDVDEAGFVLGRCDRF